MCYKILRPAMDRMYNCNVLDSILFGQKLVLDFGFHENMNQRELKSCISQVQELYGFNKINREPFDLYFCNLQANCEFARKLSAGMGNLKTSSCLVTASDKSYLDFFQKEKLVYLTPDCKNDLNVFNYDDVYIVGGLVDLRSNVPLAMSKAKSEGLRMARLPLEKYVHWGIGSKSLTLDQIVKILLTLKNSKSWTKAFQHVPGRKLYKSGKNH
uniref:RNA (guanine-9-)-methyltransferase domain-containing protein 1 n=1 Tax=Strigamia maritima TaxID=126957 RepID=T1J4R2_STRMM